MTQLKKWEQFALVLKKAGRRVTTQRLMTITGMSKKDVDGHIGTLRWKGLLEQSVGAGGFMLYGLKKDFEIGEETVTKKPSKPRPERPKVTETTVQFAIRRKAETTTCGWAGL